MRMVAPDQIISYSDLNGLGNVSATLLWGQPDEEWRPSGASWKTSKGTGDQYASACCR